MLGRSPACQSDAEGKQRAPTVTPNALESRPGDLKKSTPSSQGVPGRSQDVSGTPPGSKSHRKSCFFIKTYIFQLWNLVLFLPWLSRLLSKIPDSGPLSSTSISTQARQKFAIVASFQAAKRKRKWRDSRQSRSPGSAAQPARALEYILLLGPVYACRTTFDLQTVSELP